MVALVSMLAVAGVGGCARVGADAPDERTLSIAMGATADRPGYTALVRGAELALAAVNTERRAGGRAPITLLQPARKTTSAVEVALQWRDNSAVVGVLGHPESGATLEALPLYGDLERAGARGVTVVSPTATSPALAGRSDWLFRLAPSDVAASRALAEHLTAVARLRRAAIIYRNDSYGRDWAQAFRAEYARRGGTVVLREPYLTGVVEWPAFAALVAARAPEVVLFPGDALDAAALLRALRAEGTRPRFIGGDGTDGLLESGEFAGAQVMSFLAADSTRSASARAFFVRYRERYGADPDQFAIAGHDAALVLARAIASVDGTPNGRDAVARRRAVREWIAGLGTRHAPLEGAGGTIAFDAAQEITRRAMRLIQVAERAGATP
ncbi:MAG: ABC transporter substrate-binding protein [Gemmatimonadaceae bacterium]|nr:ABC transporter substrate-binding protein [Gemmatimonadaceae bacterium]